MPTVFDETVQAPTFDGDLTGNTTGAHLGSVTGNVIGNVTGNLAGNVNGGIVPSITNLSSNGAISIPTSSAFYRITKGSIATLTIADPTSGTDDGKVLTVWSETAFAHTITDSADGFNSKGSSGALTFSGAIGDSVSFVARGGHWYVLTLNGVTVS